MNTTPPTLQGQVLAVENEPQGGVALAWVGTELMVQNAADFHREGGQFVVEGDPRVFTYTGVTEAQGDEDENAPDTVHTVESAPVAITEETAVNIWPEALEVVAQVATDDTPDGVEATVPHNLRAQLVPGVREPAAREWVRLELRGHEWVVADVVGRRAVVQMNAVQDLEDTLAEMRDRVGVSQEQLDAAKAELEAAAKAREQVLADAQTALKAAQDQLAEDLAANKAALEAADATLTKDLSDAKAALEAKDASLQQLADALEAADNKLTADLATANTKLAQAQADLTAAQKAITDNKTATDAAQSTLAQNLDQARADLAAADQATNDALAQAQQDLNAADLGLSQAIDTAKAAAAAADAKAAAAQTSADGKNSTWDSSNPASSSVPGKAVGDTWRQVTGGVIVGVWNWTALGWVPRPISSAAIDNLDVGKLTAGTASISNVVATKLAADFGAYKVLTADKLVVGQGGNLWVDPKCSTPEAWANKAYVSASGVTLPAGRGQRVVYAAGGAWMFPVTPGSTYRASVTISSPSAIPVSTSTGMSLVFRNAPGSTNVLVPPPYYRATPSTTVAANTPTVVSALFTAPAGCYWCMPLLSTSAPDATTFTNLSAQPAAGAELIVDGAVTADKVAANAITAGKIAAGAVTATTIAAGAVTATSLAAQAVTANALAANCVTAAAINAGAVTAQAIAANAVTANAIQAGAVTAGKVAADAITANELAANAVTASELAAGAVVAGKIAANAVTAGTVAANAITAGKIAAGAVTADKLAALAVTAEKVAAGAILADKIGAGAVTTQALAAGAVTADTIAAGAITANTLAAGAITAGAIAAGAVTADALSANAVTADKLNVDQALAQKLDAVLATFQSVFAKSITADMVDLDTLNGKVLNGVDIYSPHQTATPRVHVGGATIETVRGYAQEDGAVTEVVGISLGGPTADKMQLLNPDGSVLAGFDTDGSGRSSDFAAQGDISATGKMTADAADFGSLSVGPYPDLAAALFNLPRGIIARQKLGTTAVGNTVKFGATWLGYYELYFDSASNRGQRVTYDGLVYCSAAGQYNFSMYATSRPGYDSAPAAPQADGSVGAQVAIGRIMASGPGLYPLRMEAWFGDYGGTYRVLLAAQTPTSGVYGYLASNDNWPAWFYAEDMGSYLGWSDGGYSRGGGTPYSGSPTVTETAPVIVKKTYTSTWNATGVATYRAGIGSMSTSQYLLQQGTYGGANRWSHAVFNGGAVSGETGKTIATALSGATVSKVEFYGLVKNTYYGAGGTAVLAPATQTALTSIATSSAESRFSGWKVGTAKWVTLSNALGTSVRSVAIGPDSSGLTEYIKFDPTLANLKLRITYTR